MHHAPITITATRPHKTASSTPCSPLVLLDGHTMTRLHSSITSCMTATVTMSMPSNASARAKKSSFQVQPSLPPTRASIASASAEGLEQSTARACASASPTRFGSMQPRNACARRIASGIQRQIHVFAPMVKLPILRQVSVSVPRVRFGSLAFGPSG